MLVDNEILDYKEKVSDVWPEFAKNGKSEGTVGDLMRHELGLPLLSESLHPHDFTLTNIKNNMFGEMLENEEYAYPPGERRDYHVITRGMLANEIVRRVDPKGRTIGEILRYHISEPLGARAFIGLKDDELKDTVNVEYLSPINCTITRSNHSYPFTLQPLHPY